VADGAFEAGLGVQRALWGDLVSSDGRPDTPAARVAPEFFPYVTENVFGKIWADDTLGLRERELLTVAVLTTLGRLGELRGHLHAALNIGLTADELTASIIHVGVYAGLPAAVAALDVAGGVFEPAGG
jgi:4-carboxymuconolactone decarboxylase